MKALLFVPLALTVLAIPASAQSVYNAMRAQSQPVIERNDKGFSRCGIRILVLDENGKSFDYHDMNVNVIPGHDEGMIEATRLRNSPAQLSQKGAPVPGPAATKFWMAASTQARQVVPIAYLASEKPGKMIAMTPLEPTYQLLVDIANGKTIQFAARYPKQTGGERIISFVAGLSDDDQATLDACLESVP